MQSSRASTSARSTLSVLFALTALGACSSSSSSSSSTPDAGGDDTADTGTVDAGGHADADAATTHDASGADAADSGTVTTNDSGPTSGGNESWVWVYTDYANTLTTIGTNKTSFTHVSPAFYSVNYDYASGVAYYASCPNDGSDASCTGNSSNSFDGLTTQQFTTQATGYGLVTVPLIYGGSENDGTDTGVQNILDDVGGAQAAFITAMTAEAVSNGYGGYNLDWEVGGTVDGSYAAKFVTFVNAFKVALAPHGMSLSADAIVSNINGTFCSGNSGYLDFDLLATSSIDRVIIEDYLSTLGTATTTCQAAKLSSSTPIDCDYTMTGELNMMCPQNLPVGMAVIGLDADPGSTNPIAGTAFSTVESYGFTRVAVWPQAPFMDTSGIQPAGSSWYTLLHDFLTH